MTVSKPALATLSGTGEIYLVWNDSQGRIWWSIFDGALWGRPQETALPLLPEPTVLAVSTTRYTAPPVQAGRPLMLIALQHVQGSDEQYVSTSSFDGATWAAPTRITDGSGPALAWFGGKSDPPTAELILAGTGPHGQNIWWQRYADGAWGLKQPIDGVATHGAPAIAFIDT